MVVVDRFRRRTLVRTALGSICCGLYIRLARGFLVFQQQRSVHRVPLLIDDFDVVEQPLDRLRIPDIRA